jgi:hypothetical protein
MNTRSNSTQESHSWKQPCYPSPVRTRGRVPLAQGCWKDKAANRPHSAVPRDTRLQKGRLGQAWKGTFGHYYRINWWIYLKEMITSQFKTRWQTWLLVIKLEKATKLSLHHPCPTLPD